jgi:hypothetical protein
MEEMHVQTPVRPRRYIRYPRADDTARVGSYRRVWRKYLVEIGEDLTLDFDPLRHGFDHPIAILSRLLQVSRKPELLARTPNFLLVKFSSLQLPVE